MCALLTLVGLVLLVGFDHTASNRALIHSMLRSFQIIFIVYVAYNLILRTRETIRENRVFKWVVDIAMLITAIPLIFPHPAHPWLPHLATVLYARTFIYIIMATYSVVEVSFGLISIAAKRTNPSLLMSGSFLFFIIIGSLVLMLPKCTMHPIAYSDSLFVATSAVCITGLTPVDIGSTFTPLGLSVIGVLVQIGGLGVLTFTCFFASFFSGTTSVYNQLLIRDMIYSKTMNALLPTLLYVITFTLAVEALGAVAVYMSVPVDLGLDPDRRISFAVFHALSSFCNAGFCTLPLGLATPALMTSGQGFFIVTSLLILAGGIGFPILVNFKDIIVAKIRALIQKLRGRRADIPLHLSDLNTKIVLTTYFTILGIGSVAFFVLEYDNTLAGMTLWQKIVQSVFNSLIPRSAGFASVNPASFLPITLFIVVIQMWIGGASQSLAGGIKVNTLVAVLLNVRSILTGRHKAFAFNRALSVGSIRRANAVVTLALGSFIVFTLIIIGAEPHLSMRQALFEVSSALFTVGSSLGVTADLGITSKYTLCVAMFVGRVGIISLLSGLAMRHTRDISPHLPEDTIIIN